jgi:hypothetical protein
MITEKKRGHIHNQILGHVNIRVLYAGRRTPKIYQLIMTHGHEQNVVYRVVDILKQVEPN